MLAMNYIFEQKEGEFSFYPSDGNSVVFKKICKESKANTQIAIRRDGNLMYYCYVKKLHNGQILGLCRTYNGLYLKNVSNIFDAFEKLIAKIVAQGIILKFNTNGDIDFDLDNLYDNPSHIEYTIAKIDELFEKLENHAKELPPEKYSIATDTIKILSCNDPHEEIDAASYTFGYTIIYKDSDYETIQTKTYKGVLYSITQENTSLKKENVLLKEKNNKIRQQKKQFKWISLLSILIIISLIGLYVLNNNLSGIISNQEGQINSLQTTITKQNTDIALLQDTLSNERYVIKQKNAQIRELNSKLTSYKDSLKVSESQFSSLKNTFPINISNIEISNKYYDGSIETNFGNIIYSSNTMYLTPKITYTGINTNRSISLKIKWYKPNGSLSTGDSSPNGYSQQKSLYIYSGSNTETLQGWGNKTKGHWDKGTYRIEIWYEDVCLKAKVFKIY